MLARFGEGEMHLAVWLFPVLFATGLVAGLVDSIAGGGGLITIPVLLGVGVPPHLALGTNKLQASFGSGSASLNFVRSGTARLGDCLRGIAFTFIGAALGAVTVQHLNPGFLKLLIPIMLGVIAVYTFFTPDLGALDVHPRLKSTPFYVMAGLSLGFYDGFFGPGTGSFWVVAFMLLVGFNMKKATAYTKVMNFTSNVASLLFFMLGGHVLYLPALVMAGGQVLGARMGSGLVITRGVRFVRPVFLAMVVLVTAKLIFDAYL
jgi:hypothetical protein